MQPQAIDPDLLRAFAFIAEEGSFTRAAARVGRTQSAVSMQVQRLETVLGQRVLLRGKGGSVQLTRHGRFLLERSRDLLALNDEIWTAFHTPAVSGTVRLGTPDDYAMSHLPAMLKRFANLHPAVEVDVLCLPSSELVRRLGQGSLDLTLVSQGHQPMDWPARTIWRGPLRWIGPEGEGTHQLDPLPLALASDDCAWRNAALDALRSVGRRYRIAYTSATLAGTHAPVLAGLAITVSPATWMPPGLRALPVTGDLPGLADTAILLLMGRDARQPVTDLLAQHLAGTFDTVAASE